MESLDKLFHLTKKMAELFQKDPPVSSRNQIIKKMNEYLLQRDEILKKINPPYSKKEIKIGKEILILNKKIEGEMQRLLSELRSDLEGVKKQKKTYHSYMTPPKSIDGTYLDDKL